MKKNYFFKLVMILFFSISGTLCTFADTGIVKYEAENATRSGGSVSTNAAFSGNAYVATFGAVGNYIEFTITGAIAGTQNISASYASAADCPLGLYVNGTLVATTTFNGSGGWSRLAVHTDIVTLNAGTNTIKYQRDGASANINFDCLSVNVNIIPVTGIALSPTTSSLAFNGAQQLTATVAPANASYNTVTWSSSNTSVATVSASGLVAGIAVDGGSATITATTQDQGMTATCAVTVAAAVQTSRYEAEYATRSGGSVSTDQAGYSGTGFVSSFGSVGNYIEFTILAVNAGSFDITAMYANAADSPLGLYANGVYVASTTFTNATGWNKWRAHTDNVTLNAGANIVKYIRDGASNNLNLDYLTVTKNGTTGTTGVKESDIMLSPNPLTVGSLSIKLPEAAIQLTIFDVTGKMVYQEKVIRNEYLIDQSVFKSEGIYVVNVLTTNNSINKKVIVTK